VWPAETPAIDGAAEAANYIGEVAPADAWITWTASPKSDESHIPCWTDKLSTFPKPGMRRITSLTCSAVISLVHSELRLPVARAPE
jgi:hypothetical protein